jgi:uncharacterized protein DUF4139/uncharacterized protein DUF4140
MNNTPHPLHARARASVALLACAFAPAFAAPEETTASRVTAVTVHLQQARVTREAKVVLEPGERRIVIKPLPAMLDPTSVRVSGRGGAGLAIRSVELRRLHEEPVATPEDADLEATIRELSRESALKLERRKSLDVLREFVGGLKAVAVETTSRELVPRGFAVGDWERAFDFLSSHLDRVAEEESRVDRDYGDLSHRLETARSRLAETARTRTPDRFAAEILVSAATAGPATVAITYLIDGASWTPLYDARLDPAAGRVTLDWLALVRQDTGEDWADAALTLTTSEAQRGIDLPRLASMRLVDPSRRSGPGFVTITDGVTTPSEEFIDQLPILGRNYQDVLRLAPGASDADLRELIRMAYGGAGGGTAGGEVGGVVIHGARDTAVADGEGAAPATVDVPFVEAALGGARAMQFVLPGTLSIPGDGQWHQHLITSRAMPATIEYQCVPALSPDVFLVARVSLPDDLSLLPGRVAHFVDGDLVGQSMVAARSGGEELTLSFGPEARVRAERRDLLLRTARRGRDEERDRKVVTTLSNHLGRPITVKLGDRIPVSGDDRVDVILDRDETTAGLPPDPREPGILRWEVALPPSASADVTLRYRIRVPAGMLPNER